MRRVFHLRVCVLCSFWLTASISVIYLFSHAQVLNVHDDHIVEAKERNAASAGAKKVCDVFFTYARALLVCFG